MSLQRFLLILVLLCVGPMMVLAGILAGLGVAAKQEEYKQNALNLTKYLSTEIDQFLHARISALHMLAESSLADDPARWKDLYREAKGFQQGFGNHVIFADREMHMLFNTRVPFGAKLPNLPRPKGQAAAPIALATGRPAVGDVFMGPIAKEPLVAIVVPVHRGGEIPYLMLTIFETKRFQEHLSRLALPAGWSLTILDSNNTAIARRAQTDLNSVRDVDASGRFSIKSSVAPWSVVLEIPRTVYHAPLIHTTIWFAAAILIATLISLIGGATAGRRLGKAVASLADKPVPGTQPPEITEIAAVRKLLDESATKRQEAEVAGHTSEERLRLALESAKAGIWEWNLQTNENFWSKELFKVYGLEPDSCEASYEAWRQTIHPDDRDETEQAVQEAADSGTTLNAEWRVQDPSGEERWLMSQGRPIFDAEGQPVRYIGVVMDITERKAVEARLRESEHQFRLLVENAPEAIFIQTGMRFAYVNIACTKLYGAGSREELIGIPVLERVHPDLHAVVRERIRLLNEEHQSPSPIEQKHLRMNGESIDVLVSAVPFHFQGDNGALVFVSDVTKRKQAELALKASEEKYRTVVENANEAIVIAQDGRFVYANPRTGGIIGVPSEELIGKPFVDYISPEDKAIVVDRYKRRLAGERVPDDYDFRIINTKGETRWLHIYAQQISWKERPATLNLLLDVTEQKEAAEELRKSRELEKSILSSVPHGIFGLENRRIFFASNAIDAVTGWKPEELIGKDTRIFFRNDQEYQEYGAVVYAGLQNESVFTYEPLTPFVKKDGREMYCRTSFSRIGAYSSSGNRFVSMVEDITEAKRTEIALKESVMRFDQLAEQSRTFHWEVDQDGRYTFASRIIMNVLGYDPDEVVGKMYFYDLHPEEGHDGFRKAAFAVFNKKETFRNMETPALRKNGSQVWLSTSGIPILSDDGKLLGYQGSNTDITDRKMAEKENAVLQSRLNQIQKMESIGRLAGGVAHDFNNMLGLILGHTEMAMEQVKHDDPMRDDLEEIRKAAQRSADLTRQLLAFARKQTISPRVLDLNETVDGMRKMLQRLIGEDINLLWIPAQRLWQIRMDPSQIDQILANLCVNARDAISGVGKITIETKNVTFDNGYGRDPLEFVPGEYVMLAFSDNGCGIAKETIGSIFEPFFTTKEMGKGTGLGLATVFGIMKQNSGYINVYSELDQGTTFKLYFPRYTGESDQTDNSKEIRPIQGGNETLLVVEDEAPILHITRRVLEKQGYSILTAKTPVEAIEAAKAYSGAIHLLITDVVMPEMNGRDLAEQILSLHPKIKTLFMSGYTANVIAHHGVLDKGIHFIQKPFSLNNLATKVREVLDT